MKVKETTSFIVTSGITLLLEDGNLKLVTASIGERLSRTDAKQLSSALLRAASLIRVPRVRKIKVITGEGE